MTVSTTPGILRKWYYRILTGAVTGAGTWFLAEVIFNIKYRYYDLVSMRISYVYAFIFGILILETYFRAGGFLDRILPWGKGPVKRFWAQLLAGFITAFWWIIVVRVGLNILLYPGQLIILEDEVIIFSLIMFLMLIVCILQLGYFYNESYRQSLAEMERYRKENAEYQFEMLKLQLNPHFLFNSLNTLSSLVYDNADRAAEFVRKLSEVYRYVLDNRNKELVLLKEEMEFIHAFTFLQGLRFQGMIDFRFGIDPESMGKKIAPMTLQLLIENAVKHNVASRRNPLTISVKAGNGRLSVHNNLQPKEEQPGTGVGLKNIINRYQFLTVEKVEITREKEYFEVIIPLI
ncbi:MAG TPA: histidine kinase [Bacteroidales bacterium]|nr:histidine kinase [Bacteroidales bacterium]